MQKRGETEAFLSQTHLKFPKKIVTFRVRYHEACAFLPNCKNLREISQISENFSNFFNTVRGLQNKKNDLRIHRKLTSNAT